MGIIPLQFMEGESGESLGLTGKEKFVIKIRDDLEVKEILDVEVGFSNEGEFKVG